MRPLLFLLYFGTAAVVAAQSIHTPKPGSAERQAICDAARAYVMSKYATRAIPQAIVFKIDRISATDSFANLEAVPLLKDGRYAAPEYMPDIVFNFCLRHTGFHWEVIADLSRTDVPDASEVPRLRAMLPSDFPRTLLSPTWQKLLGR